MHKVLCIPELLDEIFSYLSRQANTVSTRVCRLWFTRSIPFIWETVHLMNASEPPTSVGPNLSNGYFRQRSAYISWDRFFTYSRYIRYLKCHYVNFAILRQATIQQPSDFFSSNLTVFHWTDDETQLEHLLPLLTSSLRVLRVELNTITKQDTIDILYKTIPIRSPSLHVFESDFKPTNDGQFQAVPPLTAESLVTHLPRLISFTVPIYAITREILPILSRLQRLENLTMLHPDCDLKELCMEDSFKRNIIVGDEEAGEGFSFHSLQKINICDDGYDDGSFTMAKAFGHGVHLLKMTDLTYCPHYEDPGQIINFLESVHLVCPNLQKIMISTPCNLYSDLPWKTIQSLFNCPTLVELRSAAHVNIGLEDILTLTTNRSSWEVVKLSPSKPLSYQALIPFAKNCPDLVELGLLLDSKLEIPYLTTTFEKDDRFPSLTLLDVGDSEIAASRELEVALFLSSICAKPLKIRSSGNPRTVSSWEIVEKMVECRNEEQTG